MKRSQPKRDWTAAQSKREGGCRVCGATYPVELAHVTGRSNDRRRGYEVSAAAVVALCVKHHRAYDRHELDLFWDLTADEIRLAVEDAGSPSLMLKRTAPLAYGRINAVAA